MYAIELDALAGLAPDAFKQLVKDAVDEHFNDDIWRKVQKKSSPQAAKKGLETGRGGHFTAAPRTRENEK